MKKLILPIILLLAGFTSAIAQINVQLRVIPPYQSRIADYASRPDLMLFTVSNTSSTEQKIQLTGSITGNNGVALWVRPGYRSPTPITLAPGQVMNLNGTDISALFDYNQIQYTGISQADFTRGVGLQEGTYQICIQALDYQTQQPLSPSQPIGCAPLIISSVEPPRILAPFNQQEISENAAQSFAITWSSSPGGPVLPNYRVKMVEIMGQLNANDAIRSASVPPFFDRTVQTNSLLYGIADPILIPGRRYALMVQAIDPMGLTSYRNQGQSEVIEFTYQEKMKLNVPIAQNISSQIPSGAVPICANCNSPKPTGNPANELILQNTGQRKIKVNQFEMNILTIENRDGKLSGTGTISLPIIGQISSSIKLRVEFSDVSINSKYELLEGTVKGIRRSDFGFIPEMDNPDLNTIPLSSNEIDQLDSYFKNNQDQLVSRLNQSANSIGMELPLGIDKGAFTVGVTDIFFNSTQSWMEAVAVMNMPDANMKVAFSGRGICINPQDLCGEATLFLSEDAHLGALGMTLIGGIDGTHLVFDSKGFKLLKIGASYQFPNGAPLVNASTNEPLKVKLTATTETSWADWIAEVEVEAFKIGSISDIQFGKTGSTTKVIYDHSDNRNWTMPDKIESGDPMDAPILINNNWTGFFIPSIDVYLPQAIQKISGESVHVKATNIIYHEGICGQILVNNVLSIGEGSLDGWFLSVDEVGLNFWKNSFKQSYLKGKLVLPPSGSNATNANNQIDYSCTLTKPAGEAMAFQFKAAPKENLSFEALWTQVNIHKSSNILVQVDGEGFIATAELHGDMKFQTNIDKLPKLTLGELSFQNMKISSRAPLFDPGQIDFHTGGDNDMGWLRDHADFSDMLATNARKGPSANENVWDNQLFAETGSSSVLGFELAETKVHPFLEGNQVGFRFGAAMQLVNNVNFIPKASIDFKLYGELDGLAKNGRKFWKAVRGKIEKVELEAKAKLGPMDIEGAVYYHDIDIGGNLRDYGLGGRLNVVLPGAGMQIGMQALFGSRVGNSNFQYFYIDALLDLGQSGIPLFPGTALYGFAGGVYYNMSQDTMSRKSSVNASMPTDNSNTEDPTLIQMTSFSGTKYTPDASQGGRFGVTAGVYFGLSSRNTLEGQLAMDIRFNGHNGFEYFGLDGRAAILTGTDSDFLQRYDKAMARAHMYLKINMLNSQFHKFEAGFNYNLEYIRGITPTLVSANGGLEFYIENTLAANPNSDKGTIWYFRMGRPRPHQPNSIKFLDFLQSDAYFQVGNSVDPMPKIPNRILEIMGVSTNNSEDSGFDRGPSYESVNNTRNEQEISSGKGMVFGALTELKADPKFLIFYASLYAGVGFDVSILQRDRPECGQPAGSWYARGQAYIGAEAACGVHINVFGLKKDIEFVRAGLGASAELGGPAPLYVRGILGGRFSVLDGLISGRFNVKFTVGTICDNSINNRQLKLIADVYPGGGNVSTAAQPGISFNFPLNKDFIVPITTTDEDGNIKSVAYDLFRFRKEMVNISVTENGSQAFQTSDFDLATGLTALPPNSPSRSYYPIYKLALKSGGDLLKRKTNYQFNVSATVKYYPDLLRLGRSGMESLKDGLGDQAFIPVRLQNSNAIYYDKKDSTFTTDNGPKKISLEHLVDILPVHRHRSLPGQAMLNASSYLKLSRGYSPDNNTFDVSISAPQAMVRIVNMASGNTEVSKIDLPINTGDRTYWNFNMPALLPNNNYAVRMYLKGQPAASAPENTQGGTRLLANSTLSMTGQGLTAGGTATINSRKLIESGLRMGSGEHEVFSWYFNTGESKTFKDKYNSLKINKLIVNGMEASLQNNQQVNLSNFNWFDSQTQSVTAFNVTYEFTGNEYFNALDDGTWTVGQVFPNVGNSNTAVKLSRSYPNMNYDHAQSVTEMDRVFRDFVRQAFGSNYELTIGMVNMPWNPITGGIDSYSNNEFPYLSAIMGQDLYGINYSQNNYATAPKEESFAADLNSGNNQKSESAMVSSIILNTSNFSNLVSAQAISNSLNMTTFGQPKKVLKIVNTIHHQSGAGLTTGLNTLFKNVVQQKKNLGYPVDMVGKAGQLMDQVKNMTAPANLHIQAPVQAPQINIKMR